jgi:hypothetical protein
MILLAALSALFLGWIVLNWIILAASVCCCSVCCCWIYCASFWFKAIFLKDRGKITVIKRKMEGAALQEYAGTSPSTGEYKIQVEKEEEVIARRC